MVRVVGREGALGGRGGGGGVSWSSGMDGSIGAAAWMAPKR